MRDMMIRWLIGTAAMIFTATAICIMYEVEEPPQCRFHFVNAPGYNESFTYYDVELYAKVNSSLQEAKSELAQGHYIDPLNVIGCIPGVHVITNHAPYILSVQTNTYHRVHVEHFIDKGHNMTLEYSNGDDINPRCWCGYKRRIKDLPDITKVLYNSLIFCDACGCYVHVLLTDKNKEAARRRE